MHPTKTIKMSRVTAVFVASLLVAQAALGQTTDIDVEVSVGLGETDNVARTAVNEIDETIGMVGLDLDLDYESRKLEADIRSRFSYLEYFDDTFDSELIGGFAGNAQYQFFEDRFFWDLQYNWGQQLQDNFQPARPDNRENISLLTTGPTFVQPIGDRNFISVEASYSTLDYEFQPFDFERGLGAVRFGREVANNTFLSMNLSTQRVEFDNSAFPPYDFQEMFVRYDFDDGRNTISANLGHTSVEAAGLEGDGVLFSFDWMRQITARTVLQFNAGSRYSDQGDIFQIFQSSTQSVGTTGNFSPLGQPFRNNFASAGLQFDADRTSVGLTAFTSQEDYELIDDSFAPNRDFSSIELEIGREVTRKIFIRIAGVYRVVNYDLNDRKDEDSQGSIRLGYRFNPAFYVSLQYSHLRRESTDLFSESVENRTVLQLSYIPEWSR
tara:strand:- start:717 stop:2033 length:1317 start_codon:yes stop_codon:yes gene_type:complete